MTKKTVKKLKNIFETVYNNPLDYINIALEAPSWELIPETLREVYRISDEAERFCLACKQECVKNNISMCRMLICVTDEGEHHCVLEYNQTIFDNKFSGIVTKEYLDDIGYKFLHISSFDCGGSWFSLSDEPELLNV